MHLLLQVRKLLIGAAHRLGYRRGDLLEEVKRLTGSAEQFDVLVIESTGVSDPSQVAEAFEMDPEMGSLAKLDTCVTVVDAANFVSNFNSVSTTAEDDRSMEAELSDNIVDLLVSQVEFADILILNKADITPARELEQAEATLRRLNPGVELLVTSESLVPLDKLLLTGKYSLEGTAGRAGWLQALDTAAAEEQSHAHSHSHSHGHGHGECSDQQCPATRTDQYVSSFVYSRRIPFHPQRLMQFLKSNFVFFEVSDEAEGVEEEHREQDVRAYGNPPLYPTHSEDTGEADDQMQQQQEDAAVDLVARRQQVAASSSQFGRIVRSKGTDPLLTHY